MSKAKWFVCPLFLIAILVVCILGYVTYSRNPSVFQNISERIGTESFQNLNLQELRKKLTPELHKCIVQRLGADEARKLLQEVRATKTVSSDIKEKLASCFEENFEIIDPPSLVVPDKKEPTNNVDIKLVKSGLIEGYNFWLYENTKYPCGKSGNHEFVVLQKGENKDKRNLLVRFHGGGFGFYKSDGTYSSNPPSLINQLYAEKERNGLFNSALENGLAKLVRENPKWRIVTPSHCSHDMYTGTGQFNKYDGFARWGFSAAQAAIDFTEKEFPTFKAVTSGSSAGSTGAFRNGLNREEVAGIVMDSNANDTSTIINYCNQNIPVCCADKSSCDCYDQGRRCLEIGAERVGANIGQDEPRIMIEQGKVNKPIYYIWNQHDQYFGGQFGNQNTSYFYQPTHDAIVEHNPGGKSVAKMVCVTNPASQKACYIHSPTKYDHQETKAVYDWIIALTK